MEGESREDRTRALSRKIMSVLSQAESRDEDERTRYEITGIKGRVKSRARTGHRRNRNITIGINSVPRSVSLHHLLRCILSVYLTTSFFHPLAYRRPPPLPRLIVDARYKFCMKTAFDRKLPAAPRDGNNYAISENACAQSGGRGEEEGGGFCRAISSRL